MLIFKSISSPFALLLGFALKWTITDQYRSLKLVCRRGRLGVGVGGGALVGRGAPDRCIATTVRHFIFPLMLILLAADSKA